VPENKLVCDASSTKVDNMDLAASSTKANNMALAIVQLSWFGLGQRDQCGYRKQQIAYKSWLRKWMYNLVTQIQVLMDADLDSCYLKIKIWCRGFLYLISFKKINKSWHKEPTYHTRLKNATTSTNIQVHNREQTVHSQNGSPHAHCYTCQKITKTTQQTESDELFHKAHHVHVYEISTTAEGTQAMQQNAPHLEKQYPQKF
jgi:hypothetical protein